MSSITRESNGRRTVQFVGTDGWRRSIRLGKATQRHAEKVKRHVEHLVSASLSRSAVEPETARWLAEIGGVLHQKLAAAGLVKPRESGLLADFIEAYFKSRTDLQPSSRTALNTNKQRMLRHFKRGMRLQEVTPGHADDYARWLREPKGGNLSEATARKAIAVAKQVFRAAVRRKLIPENPFEDLSGAVPANRDRDYFISPAEASAVLAACPDDQWRLMFALSRYGG